MKKGNIIFLNGVSSSGKTTLAKALQESLDEIYYLVSVDWFMLPGFMMPKKHVSYENANHIEMFKKTASGMNHTIKLYSDLGLNVVVDHVLLNYVFSKDPKTLEECVDLLHDYPVLFVNVTCPLKELRRREKTRGDRCVGHAEEHLKYLVPKNTYDLVVDTHKGALEELVEKIIKALVNPKSITALKTLWIQQQKAPTY